MKQFGSFSLIIGMLGAVLLPALALERVQFNHSGLTDDLGVGLWAWPTTVDRNQDGTPDLLVGAEDGRFYYLNNSSNLSAKP